MNWRYWIGSRIESFAWRHNFCGLHRWAWVNLSGRTSGPCSHDRRTDIPCHPCGGVWSMFVPAGCDEARAEWEGKGR